MRKYFLVMFLVSCGGQLNSMTDGEAPDGGSQMAAVKFCNNLVFVNEGNADIGFNVGYPPVTIRAASGTCAPDPGEPCALIGPGIQPYQLTLEDEPGPIGAIPFEPGEARIIQVSVNETGRITLYSRFSTIKDCPNINWDSF